MNMPPTSQPAYAGIPAQLDIRDLRSLSTLPARWVLSQKGLGHAASMVLLFIADGHTGFQRLNDQCTFFMLRERLEGDLPRGMCWRTFLNHRSRLVSLGLLELVERAKNQFTRYSRWRLRFDRVIGRDGALRHISDAIERPMDIVADGGAPTVADGQDVSVRYTPEPLAPDQLHSVSESFVAESLPVPQVVSAVSQQHGKRPLLPSHCSCCPMGECPLDEKVGDGMGSLEGSGSFSPNLKPIRTESRSPPADEAVSYRPKQPSESIKHPLSRAEKRRRQRAADKAAKAKPVSDSPFITYAKGLLSDMGTFYRQRHIDALKDVERDWARYQSSWLINDAYDEALLKVSLELDAGRQVRDFVSYVTAVLRDFKEHGRQPVNPNAAARGDWVRRMGWGKDRRRRY